MVKPFMIGTMNAKDMLHLGVEILRKGGSAIDAVEVATNAVEENPEDMSVGLGGLPNLLGTVQLDASIMDGRTLRSGAVAAVEGYVNAISIARKVMDVSPHVLLVGPGAELFAKAMGFELMDLSTEKSRKFYDIFVRDALGEIEEERTREWMAKYVRENRLREWYERISTEHHGTVNVMAMDAKGDICSGVSTSGLFLKLPGRVGDSPIIGAGNYCDNRVGAAACTGIGELAIRLSTARTVVSYMENGEALREACVRAMRDVLAINETGGMNCIALDRHGNTMSASTDWDSVHCYMDVESEAPEERRGVWVKA
jgi:beta-aspartyl-peptidase (threonine type)